MKKYVKLSLTGRNVESLVVLGANVSTAMKANPKFPAPPVSITVLADAVTALDSIHKKAENTHSKLDFADERAQVLVVEDLLRSLGNYVNMVANGSEQVIMSAAMPASKTPESQPPPAQVTNLTAKYTGIPGTVMLAWRRPQFSKLFRVYMSTDPTNEQSWVLMETIDKRKLMVQNLARGLRCYFKIVPVGTAGVGPDSATVSSIAA